MKIVKSRESIKILWENRETQTNDLLKIVVDLERQIMAVDAEMHADLEELLLENGSDQKDLWGANLYPGENADNFIEYTSFINIRPADGNRGMEVTDSDIRKKITDVINKLIQR